jgi:glycolate oxidase FAD binding subunit
MVLLDAPVLAREIGALLSPRRVRAPQGYEARTATIIAEAEHTDEIAEMVRKCETDKLTVAAVGSARTLSAIRFAPVDIGVSLRRMNRIIAYEPHDMTVVAEAGLTLGVLNREMGSQGQRLPADPAMPDLTTLGSLVASAKAGPIRLSEGTVRDLLIGIRFVGHSGRVIHGGGQVVKNVAGYDLMKIMTGSFGTLGIITETTFKVRPIPENYSLAITAFDQASSAFEVAHAVDSAAQLIHLELLSPAVSAQFGMPGQFVMLAGFGGSRTETEHQRARITEALATGTEIVGGVEATSLYERLRDFEFSDFALAAQIAVLPVELARCLDACRAEYLAHPLSGVARIFLAAGREQEEIRRAVKQWRELAHGARGNLRILAARPELPADASMFDEPPEPALKLMRRLKATFDPHRIFNPACFVGGL